MRALVCCSVKMANYALSSIVLPEVLGFAKDFQTRQNGVTHILLWERGVISVPYLVKKYTRSSHRMNPSSWRIPKGACHVDTSNTIEKRICTVFNNESSIKL
jgi:hypothetical protein